jgi:hypothetical protein
MRIGLENGGTIYWLAGESGVAESIHSSVADYSLSGDRQLDIAPIVKADVTRQFDRGNQPNEVTFSTTRKFTTADLCFIYTLDYLENIPLTGTLIFQVDIPGGGTSSRVMANAIMQRPEMDPVGVSLTLDYTITGGRISDAVGKYLTPTGGGYLTPTSGYYLTGT